MHDVRKHKNRTLSDGFQPKVHFSQLKNVIERGMLRFGSLKAFGARGPLALQQGWVAPASFKPWPGFSVQSYTQPCAQAALLRSTSFFEVNSTACPAGKFCKEFCALHRQQPLHFPLHFLKVLHLHRGMSAAARPDSADQEPLPQGEEQEPPVKPHPGLQQPVTRKEIYSFLMNPVYTKVSFSRVS